MAYVRKADRDAAMEAETLGTAVPVALNETATIKRGAAAKKAKEIAEAVANRPSMFDDLAPAQKDMLRRLDILSKQICLPDAKMTNVGNYGGMFQLGMSTHGDVANQLRSVMQSGTPEEKAKAEKWIVALGWTHVGGTLPK